MGGRDPLKKMSKSSLKKLSYSLTLISVTVGVRRLISSTEALLGILKAMFKGAGRVQSGCFPCNADALDRVSIDVSTRPYRGHLGKLFFCLRHG
jgi:hypothetical protein